MNTNKMHFRLHASIVLFIMTSAFLSSGCHAQEPLGYIVAKSRGSLQTISKKQQVDIKQLRLWNAHIKNDVVNKNDTIFLMVHKLTVQTGVRPKYESNQIYKSNLFTTTNYNGKKLFVCKVNPHQYQIEVYNQQQSNRDVHNFNSLALLKKNDLIFAVNGGMFEEDLSPVGLLISGGNVYNEINLRHNGKGNFYDLPPNGVFLIDRKNKAYIVPSEKYAALKLSPLMATQSGPMLVIKGEFNESFREGSSNLNIRNGVGVDKYGNVLFVNSIDPVNFYEFAAFFRDELQCDDALYLDGFVSQYYIPGFHGALQQRYPLGVFITVSKHAEYKQSPDAVVTKKPAADSGLKGRKSSTYDDDTVNKYAIPEGHVPLDVQPKQSLHRKTIVLDTVNKTAPVKDRIPKDWHTN